MTYSIQFYDDTYLGPPTLPPSVRPRQRYDLRCTLCSNIDLFGDQSACFRYTKCILGKTPFIYI